MQIIKACRRIRLDYIFSHVNSQSSSQGGSRNVDYTKSIDIDLDKEFIAPCDGVAILNLTDSSSSPSAWKFSDTYINGNHVFQNYSGPRGEAMQHNFVPLSKGDRLLIKQTYVWQYEKFIMKFYPYKQ